MKAQRAMWLVALVLLIVSIGCGDSRPPVYPVKGKITFDKKPMVGGGAISFVPVGDQKGKTAGGIIDAEGNYQLITHKEGDGSMVGEYRVVITQEIEKEGVRTPDGEKKKSRGPNIVVAPADQIPGIYGDHHKSPLRATVEAKDLNTIDFHLKRE